jgi:Flp pilus assembly protein TadG
MPLFAAALLVLLLMAAAIIDGTIAFQTYRDVDTIAYHAARAGANEVVANCQAGPGVACPIDQARARNAATAYALDWLAENDLNFGLPARAPRYSPVVAVRFPTPTSIEVTITRCYAFQFPIVLADSADCPGTWTVQARQVAQGLSGL